MEQKIAHTSDNSKCNSREGTYITSQRFL